MLNVDAEKGFKSFLDSEKLLWCFTKVSVINVITGKKALRFLCFFEFDAQTNSTVYKIIKQLRSFALSHVIIKLMRAHKLKEYPSVHPVEKRRPCRINLGDILFFS